MLVLVMSRELERLFLTESRSERGLQRSLILEDVLELEEVLETPLPVRGNESGRTKLENAVLNKGGSYRHFF